jgi:methionine--tRNA ligase beta chain
MSYLFLGDTMANITYDDFMKVDIRVGTIIEAKPHPNAAKLLVLKIDEGKEEPRQLVAGIKEHYSPEQLIGKQIAYIANLEPRTLRGITSNGMILAASDDQTVAILTVEKPVKNFAQVK